MLHKLQTACDVCERVSNVYVMYVNVCITYLLCMSNVCLTYKQYIDIRWKFCAMHKILEQVGRMAMYANVW